MRLSKAWTVATNDFDIFRKKKGIIVPIIAFEVWIAIGLPLIIWYISSKSSGLPLLTYLTSSFSFWFVISASILPVGIASYSLVGEKIQKSLEPLLATPITDIEILAGKAIAAFLPAISINFIGSLLYMLLVDLFTDRVLGYLYYPNASIVIIVLLVTPLACILSIGYNVLISSRSNDTRAAGQTGLLIVLPFGAVYLLSEINILPLTPVDLLLFSAALVVVDVVVFYIVRAAFQREEILTKWK